MPLLGVPGHAFVSYVREDAERVDALVKFLEARGIEVWHDRDKLWPGDDWQTKIQQAIQQDALAFVACFSHASMARIKSYQNSELRLAVDEYKSRQPGTAWLFPVRLDDVELPPFDLGGGKSLNSLQRCDLFGPGRGTNLERLASSIARVIHAKPRSIDKPLRENGPKTPPAYPKTRHSWARSHLERLLVRWRALRLNKIYVIASAMGALALLALVLRITVIPGTEQERTPHSTPPASPLPSRSPSPIASRAAKSTNGPCGYTEEKGKLADGTSFDVGLPPDPKPTPTTSYTAVFKTNLGTIRATLDGESAPCNVQSIKYLIDKKFYDETVCPRSVDFAVFGVQCGDPSGTTLDGPTYTTKDENLIASSYTAGTIVMANRGPNTNSSQIFFITEDSNPVLQKYFTVIGHVTDGLTVLQKVVSGGNDGSNPSGGGKPNISLYITSVGILE